ncbi:MAG: glycoside-pentoside-hexuronide (GPH):cation symporter [Rhodospirillaceae bacterium]|nr:glycoside-pentoside-hexuronide (GPH):cation symporter [Rhodospirillaceae bacterium]
MADSGAVNRLTFGQKLGWATGAHGTSTMIGVLVTYLLNYMTDVLGIAAFLAGAIIFAARMYDLVTDPLMGYISDRTQSHWGRRRPYLLLGSIVCFIAFVALFNVPDINGEIEMAAYTTFLLILFTTAYTIFNVPHLAMPAEMTDSYNERTSMMGYRVVFFTTANLGLFLGGALLIRTYGPEQGYSLMGWALGSVLLISMLVAFFSTRAVPRYERSEERHISVRDQLTLVADNKPFMIFLAVKLCQLIAQASSQAALIFFGVYVLQRNEELLLAFGTYFTISTFVAIPLWTWAGKRFGKKPTYMAAAILYAIVMSTWLLSDSSEAQWIVNARIFGIGLAVTGILVMGFSILPDTMEYDRRRTGLNREGIYAGLYSTMEKAASGFGPLLFGAYLGAMGYVSTRGSELAAQPDAAVSGIYIGLGVFPAAAAALSAVLLLFYKLDEKTLKATGPGSGATA